MPQRANLTASASVDFPLPRAPMIQVSPRGIFTLRPGRNPPLISIFSTTHMCSPSAGAGQAIKPLIQSFPVKAGIGSYATVHQKLVRAAPEPPAEPNVQIAKATNNPQRHLTFPWPPTPNGRKQYSPGWTSLTEMWPRTRCHYPRVTPKGLRIRPTILKHMATLRYGT